MGTSFEEIYDLALIVIRDYRIDNLAKNQYELFLKYMQGTLVRSLADFHECLQSLDYIYDVETEKYYFVNTLSRFEKSILADLMVNTWFFGNVNDITQMNLKLQGRDKKTMSESSNLKEKTSYYDRLREKTDQTIQDYLIYNL